MKKLVAFVLTLALVLACVSALASDKEYTFKWAEVNPAEHLMSLSALQFGAKLEELSGGRMKMELYPAMQLGDEANTLLLLQMGECDFFRGNAVSMGDFGAKKMSLLALPFIFQSRDHLWAVLESEVGDEILASMQECGSGMCAIGWFEEGARHFFFTKQDVASLADMKGMKIRVSENELSMDIVRAFGASPTPISYSELYTSLQTGVIDGAENPAVGYASNSFFEVASHFTYGGYSYTPSPVLVSEMVWEGLDEEDQAIVKEAIAFAQAWNKENAAANENAALETAKAHGAVVTEANVAEFVEAAKPVYEKYGADYADLIAKIQSMVP